MASNVTNRVYLPNKSRIYVSDDQYGDQRLMELFNIYGNLKVESCYKELGSSLDSLKSFWTGTIKEFLS